jgi:endonuclease YncB( thermonuclease family)
MAATVLSVYDGDTFTARAKIWPSVEVETSVRVDGVDTPELRGKCPKEVALARAARDRVKELTAEGVILTRIRHGKYAGRVVARVLLPDGSDLAVLLVKEGFGREYHGGKRESWCP